MGDTSLAPLSLVYIYGTFPQGLPKDFSVTVGGIAGYVSAIDSTNYITAVLPSNAPLGAQPLVVSWQGAASNTFPITLRQYAPEFETTTVVPVTPQGPQFPLASYYPFAHSNDTPVTLAAPAAPGEKLISLISGVGPTNPPVKLGGINSFEPLATPPVVTVGGVSASIARAGTSGTSVEVDFVVPNSAPTGFASVVLTIAGIQSNTVTIPVGSQPFVTAVLNAASFRSPGTVTPGSIISIFGAGFGPSDNLTAFPQTNVNGTSVMFGTVPAPLFALAAMEGQINALVPYELPTSGAVDLMVQDSSGMSSVMTLNLAPAVPGMFFYQDPTVATRRNAVALVASTGTLAMPTSMAAAMGISNGQPAHIGDVLQLFVTGLGKATPNGDPNGQTLTTGSVAPGSASPLYETIATPIVLIGGAPATVQFSGIAPGFAGLYQINVPIPAGIQTGNDVPIQIGMPGSPTDAATIAVSQ
jgi:uncharacterized protein (TIGR03437 family)